MILAVALRSSAFLKVTIPEKEAMEVYNSFSQWLAWAQLSNKNG